VKILFATTNHGKLAEMSVMLDLNIDWLSLSDFPNKVIYFLSRVLSVRSPKDCELCGCYNSCLIFISQCKSVSNIIGVSQYLKWSVYFSV